jgi:lariat debranching enzyme
MSGQLGSPPLFNLLRNLQPEWWFSAHLHTRFEACVVHGEPVAGDAIAVEQVERDPNEIVIDDEAEVSTALEPSRDPNEIAIDDEEVEIPPVPEPAAAASRAPLNPDEITLSDLEDEVAPPPPPPPVSVPSPPRHQPSHVWTRPVAGPGQRTTNFLALDKCGNKRQYLEVRAFPSTLHSLICAPGGGHP